MAAKILTIRQLASLAGVSRSTASLCLQNHPRISEETRARVRKIADQHGYRPDPLTATLMNHLRVSRGRRGAEKLAFLTFWPTAEGWRKSQNDLRWYEGARLRADGFGYGLDPIWAREPGMTAARLSRILYARGIRGAVLAALVRTKGHLSLNWKNLAVAAIGHTVAKPDLHRASHSHYLGMMTALRKLRHLGYRRIGFANLADQSRRVGQSWLAGYLVYQQELLPKNRLLPFLPKTWDEKEFAAWVERFRPDAIVSNHRDPVTLLRKIGLKVPADVAFAHLDRSALAEQVAGIDQQHSLIAAAAVDLVVGQLQGNEYGLPAQAKVVSLDGIWCDGPTAPRRE